MKGRFRMDPDLSPQIWKQYGSGSIPSNLKTDPGFWLFWWKCLFYIIVNGWSRHVCSRLCMLWKNNRAGSFAWRSLIRISNTDLDPARSGKAKSKRISPFCAGDWPLVLYSLEFFAMSWKRRWPSWKSIQNHNVFIFLYLFSERNASVASIYNY